MPQVWMTNPALPPHPPVQVDTDAFELVWRLRGFETCDPPVDDPDPHDPDLADPDGGEDTDQPASTRRT